jgi:hypothetical protein
MEGPSAERLARNEAFFREVNERIKDVADGLEGPAPYEFLCECADASCTERISLSPEEYERVRAKSVRFVLAPGHAAPEIEHVVEREAGHIVVDKLGVAGEVAASLDPRAA